MKKDYSTVFTAAAFGCMLICVIIIKILQSCGKL